MAEILRSVQFDKTQANKETIRNKVSDILLESKIAKPDPIFHLSLDHFIPDFVGSITATENVTYLPEWQAAQRIFITPDRSTQLLREIAIKQGKEIEVTTYGISRGAVLLNRSMVPDGQEAFAASLDGMERFGKPLQKLSDLKEAGPVDMMITGAIAISSEHGGRTGKGAGWFDAEWIIWKSAGLVTRETPIVGIVHDVQVINEGFELKPWDVTVCIIATPSGVIRTPGKIRPDEIYWEKMNTDWRDAIPFMRELYLMRVDSVSEP